MPTYILSLISSAGVSAALCGALVFLARNWIGERLKRAIGAEYDSKLEVHKAQLQASNAERLESFKAQLAMQSAKDNAVHAALVKYRFDAIKAVLGPLLEFHEAVAALVNPLQINGGPDSDERIDRVVQAQKAFVDAYQPNRIFLPKRCADHVAEIRSKLVSNANVFTHIVSPAIKGTGIDDPYAKWNEVYVSVSSEVSRTIAEMEAEMRTLMGDERS
jgi:hypothetical protein